MRNLFISNEKINQTFGTLDGLIAGIKADQIIKESEAKALRSWLEDHHYLSSRQPFCEIISIVKDALSDNILTHDEIEDIRFVCANFLNNYGGAPIGNLLGLVGGIAADSELNEQEWTTLKTWLKSNSYLKGSWPYDEIECLTTKHYSTSELTPEESRIIITYFADFCGFNKNRSLTHPLNEPGKAITGICAVCPDIEIEGKVFSITGRSKKYLRKEISDRIHAHKGYFKNTISGLTDYLVVCTDGSPMWIYSCYGRKVETAVTMRKEGHRIQIIHEFDLWDYFEEVA